MMENVKDLLDFCHSNEELICYGAGQCADTIRIFLETQGIEFVAYCITNKQDIKCKEKWNRPWLAFNELKLQDNTGIVVCMNSKNQEEIKSKMRMVPEEKIFYINNVIEYDIEVSFKEEMKKRRFFDSVLYNLPDLKIDEDESLAYQEKVELFLKNFDKVWLQPGEMLIGGVLNGYMLRKFYLDSEPRQYTLLVPWQSGKLYENHYVLPNKYVLERADGENFSFVTEKSLPFWKKLMAERPEIFVVKLDVSWRNDYMPILNKKIREVKHPNYDGLFNLSEEEEKRGKETLIRMGVNSEFICMFARNAEYHKNLLHGNLDIHRQIMDMYRNSNINDYFLAASEIAKTGFACVRVGKDGEELIENAPLVDYATKWHNDFMDVYLAKKCKFFVGDGSGMNLLYLAGNKPLVFVNYPYFMTRNDGAIPLEYEKNLIIYNKFWNKYEGRFMTMREMLEFKYNRRDDFGYCDTLAIFEEYYRQGIMPVYNTPEEIWEVTNEMQERLEGRAEYTEEDENLQQRYWDIIEQFANSDATLTYINARVGREYLRKNKWLLD